MHIVLSTYFWLDCDEKNYLDENARMDADQGLLVDLNLKLKKYI